MLIIPMFRESWISIKSNKLRSFLTILGVLIGVCAVVLMVATGQTVRNEINKELESFGGNKLIIGPGRSNRKGVNSSGGKQTLSYGDYEAIKKVKDVKGAAATFAAGAMAIYGSYNWPTKVFGVTTEYFSLENYELESGSYFTDQDVIDGLPYAIIGQTIVENMFSEGEDPIGATIRIGNTPFTVIGVLKEKGSGMGGTDGDDIILAPLFTVKRRLSKNKIPDSVAMITVMADNEEALPYVQKRIEILLQERHRLATYEENDFEIMNLKEIADKVSNIGVILSILLASIASISLIVGSIGIMNMMLVSVTERTREIGIRKAIGAKDNDIMIQFLFESILISMVGSFVGMLFGIIFSQIGGYILNKNVPISLFTIFISIFIAILVGIVSGIVPANKATKLDPIEALRYQ